MAAFRNQFSWSFSRHKMFHDCPRRYYWNYYGYWNGWKEDAPDQARLAYRLKKMASLPMWLGDLVHRAIEKILGDMRNQETRELQSYQKQARAWMNKEWKQSIEKKWQWKPKWNLNLFEHYYGVELTPERRMEARDKVFNCLTTFMESELFGELARLGPREWKSVEKLNTFQVGGQPVYVKFDLAAEPGGDGVVIYDWKTGKESEDTRVQLGCYSLYAHQVWRIPIEYHRLVSFYLASDTVREYLPAPTDLVETKDFILLSMERMIEVLESDVEGNAASRDNLPMTKQRAKCKYCFFREICYETRDLTPEMSGAKGTGASDA